ncbi:hypothetical protein A8990_11498 [Paenibacillus taihuensis]|uniref:Uncharacterized protein n=1 Tax=Paenibacillus taihuensis TaxID=1156355 RepID=A0A3D9RX61_9BACL|nr:hypothetical protein A8990_11498 [Paenibacillus taihuensis]
MNCCALCSNETEKLFSHMTHDLGSLCIECYMKLHGSCGVCSQHFLPSELKLDVTYQILAKFIGLSNKNLIVCDNCFDATLQQLPHKFA